MGGMEDGFTVSDLQWAALALVVSRADSRLATLIAKKAEGDAAITRKTAGALHRRGFISLTDGNPSPRAWPTPAGRRALDIHQRRQHGRP